jgi:cell division protein FtsB
MSSRFSHTSNLTKIIIITEFLLVGYLVYSLTTNVYQSYQIDKYIEAYEVENLQIESENMQKRDDYLYFTSEEYIDKIAKQNLGLINSGEEVIVLSPDVLSDDIVLEEEDSADFARHSGMTNPEQWWDFFFGG